MDYSSYLPEIDVEDGIARVVNNAQLYFRLLKKSDVEAMAGKVVADMREADFEKVASDAHALRGAAANLSFPSLRRIMVEIEGLAKDGQDCSHLAEPLEKITADLMAAIARLLKEHAE